MAFDLHTHSCYSDGLLTPEQLVARAKTVGLEGLALTDHDTLDGITRFLQAGQDEDILCLPGVELSTVYRGVECHILGYRIDHRHQGLQARLAQVLRARQDRAKQMIERLAQHGLNLSWPEVVQYASGKFVGSVQIYRALKAKGLIGEDREKKAFAYYLGPQGVAYVPHRDLSSVEAIALIKAAGGVPVLAHPGRTVGPSLIKDLTQHGLAGIEVYHPHHPPELITEYTALAGELGLFVTGGSDFHGIPGESELGLYHIEHRELERLLQN